MPNDIREKRGNIVIGGLVAFGILSLVSTPYHDQIIGFGGYVGRVLTSFILQASIFSLGLMLICGIGVLCQCAWGKLKQKRAK